MTSTTATVRVAAAQLAGGVDLDANLAACLAAIDQAADGDARLVVLPEFANHLSWYDDAAHCWRVALELDGPWLGAIAARARARGLHVVVNVTVRRDAGACTATSLLYGADGALLGASDKQILIGHENDFLRPATTPGAVVDTRLGRLGLYACMDGVIAEPPRALALRGADLLCNSLNSFASDEAALHVPVRAAENRVFVIAANKVGPLIPAALLAPVSAATAIPEQFLHGAGESQIVGPDGAVLARAGRHGAAVVFADIVPARARDKRRPDGTDVFAARRPALYQALGAAPDHAAGRTEVAPAAARVEVAAVALEASDDRAIDEAAARVAELTRDGVELIVLPELFAFAGGRVDGGLAAIATRTARALHALARACAGDALVVTSLPHATAGGLEHHGVAVGSRGVVLRQPQLHAVARHGWARLGTVDAARPLATLDARWGRLAIVVGDDTLYPETGRLAGLTGAAVVAAPLELIEPWEASLGLVERAAENRVHLVAASRASLAGTSLIAALPTDFTIMTPWAERAFDGVLSAPPVSRARLGPGVLRATLAPTAAANKVVSHRTDLLANRPWRLLAALLEEPSHVA